MVLIIIDFSFAFIQFLNIIIQSKKGINHEHSSRIIMHHLSPTRSFGQRLWLNHHRYSFNMLWLGSRSNRGSGDKQQVTPLPLHHHPWEKVSFVLTRPM